METLINKLVLVSVRYFDLDRTSLLKESRLYGHVVSVTKEDGIGISVAGKEQEIFMLPSELSAWKKAGTGHYVDEKTGHEISNPDYLVNWSVFRTQSNHRDGDHEWWQWQPCRALCPR